MNPNDLLDSKQTCELLGISRQTLYFWIEKGKIKPWRKLGGREAWFFLLPDVNKARGKKYHRVDNE